MIEIKSISKVYDLKNGKKVEALKELSFSLPETGLVFINGESGSGKTTLMNIISGLDSCTSGEIKFEKDMVTSFSEGDWDRYRNKLMGIVFQDFNLLEDLTVGENILLPLKIQDNNEEEFQDKLKEILKYVGLDGYENRRTKELSAGQLQRVAIARAIVKKPCLVIADEATGNLDPKTTTKIMNIFNKLSKSCLVILISHDKQAAKIYGDRIITLKEGKIIEDKDNSKMKELSLKAYNLNIKRQNSQEKKLLREFDLKDELIENGEWEKGRCKNLKIELSLESTKEENEEEIIEWKNKDIKTKRMDLKEIVVNSLRNMKKQKTRTIIMITLISFICMIFLSLNIFFDNDYIESIARNIKDTKQDYIPVYKKVLSDEYGIIKQYKGKNFLNELEAIIGKENIVKSFEEIEILYGEKFENNETIDAYFFENNKTFQNIIIEGKLPEENNQVSINKKFANTKNIKIGDEVIVSDIKCEVVGFIDTINKSNELIAAKNIMKNEVFNSGTISFQGVNVLKSVNKKEFGYSANLISPVSKLKKNKDMKLLYGRLPEKKNEILISKEEAEKLGDYNTGNIITKYRIPDLSDKKYNNEYDSINNLYDYTGRNVEIVGVYELEEYNDDMGGIIFCDDVYNSIVEDYLHYLNYSNILLKIENNHYSKIKEITEKEYYIDTTIGSYIYDFKDYSDELRDFFFAILFAFVIIIVFILISFLTYNVKDHSKQIGIFRAMGVEAKDISKIFLYESAILCVVSIFIAILGTITLVSLVDEKITKLISNQSFEMFNLDYIKIVTYGSLIIVLGILLTVIPIYKMIKSKSINLIKM